ncbi:MAG: DUF2147 domain-containing protein [Pseudomonadota bacterium]
MGEQRRIGLAAGLCLMLMAQPSLADTDTDPAFGRWIVDSGKAVIELFSCGEEACGILVWLRNPLDEAGRIKRDIMNPDPEARERPICGLRLVTGLTRDSVGDWKGGEIYSTRDGNVYGIDLVAKSASELKVRGYLGISLLGQTQTWRRDTEERGYCVLIPSNDANDR